MNTRRDFYAEGLALSAAERHADAIECFEEALDQRPGDMRVLFALGNTAQALGMAQPAEIFFRKVLEQDPARVEALVNLGNLLRAQGQFAAAEAVLAPALARNPGSAELWLTLASTYRELGNNSRAAAHYRKALALRPDYPAAMGNLADILADEGDVAGALALYDRVLAREPDNAQARLNRAVLYLLQGKLEQGWRDYAARLNLGTPKPDRRIARWNGASLSGHTLLVTAEQGIGDQIMFASLIPELAARAEHEKGNVLLECEARLVPLFARSFPRLSVHASRIETRGGVTTARYDWLQAAGGADVTVETGTLPAIMRTTLAQFSAPHRYLVPDAAERARWRRTFQDAGRGPWTGVCWRSGLTGGARAVQYAPPTAWADFLRNVPGMLVCTQYDATPAELNELEMLSGRKIFLPRGIDQKNEIDRTCAMLSALDAVVSAPTAVSWLAAAAGVPVAKVLYDTSWTSFAQDYEPFAPSSRLMMPAKRGDWADAFVKAIRWLNAQLATA